MIRILVTTDEGQVEAATVDLSGKKVSIDVNEGYDGVKQMLDELTCFDEDCNEISQEDDPKKWYDLLPQNLAGSYMRAEKVD